MKNRKKKNSEFQKEETTLKTEVYSGEQNTINVQMQKASENSCPLLSCWSAPASLSVFIGPSKNLLL